jgi:hypothetical protein
MTQTADNDALCEQCKRPLSTAGLCCWPDLCGDCEDANQAAMDAVTEAAARHSEATACNLSFADFSGMDDEPCVDGGQPREHP